MPAPVKKPGTFESLDLEQLVTFRLSRLSETLARGAVKLYSTRFDMGIAEWRVMALLGRYAPLTANEIVQRTGVDKSWVSRSVADLIALGYVVRNADPANGRQQLLALSPLGLAVYRKIAPLARARHERLLATLSPGQRKQLMETLDHLQRRAEAMLAEDDATRAAG